MSARRLNKRWINYNKGNYFLAVLNYYKFVHFSLINFSAILLGPRISNPAHINSAQVRTKLLIFFLLIFSCVIDLKSNPISHLYIINIISFDVDLFLCKFVKSLM